MNDNTERPVSPEATRPAWQPINATDRRVLGVLAEKAKTTPDNYPLSLNAVCTGSNQKSNRAPLMNLEPEDAESSLERLRGLGAVIVVQGSGRVDKYRHNLYQWLGADKVELAVMAELLLRGPQTEGELRGRAARMEPIPGLSELRPILHRLKEKGLVVSLTPAGRGHVVSHALYKEREWERVRAAYQGNFSGTSDNTPSAPAALQATNGQPLAQTPDSMAPAQTASTPSEINASAESVQNSLEDVRNQVDQLQQTVLDLTQQMEKTNVELKRLKEALGE